MRRVKLIKPWLWWMPGLFFLIAWAGAFTCHRQQTMGAELRRVGTVTIMAPDATAADRIEQAIAGYRGAKITIHAETRAKNESALTVWESAGEAKLTVFAPVDEWPKIIAAALRLPHECTGDCWKTLFVFTRFK